MNITQEVKIKKDKNDKRTENRKYFFLKASNICYIDENDNIVTLEDFLNRSGINSKNRFAIFQIEPGSKKVKEFLTDTEFDVKKSIQLDNGIEKSIYGNSNQVKNSTNDPYDYQCYEGIYFNAQRIDKKVFEVVKRFIATLKSQGELESYFNAVSSFMMYGKLCSKKRKLSTMFSGYKLTLSRSKEFKAQNQI